MKIFDTHCHLAGSELQSKASELARRACEGGVMGLALVAADEPSLKEVPHLAQTLERENPGQRVVYTSGIHPHDSEKIDESIWKLVRATAEGGASAIGETGLDYYYDHSDREIQKNYFSRHIDLACELSKPLVIHCRNAVADVMAALETDRIRKHPNPGILHCFTEDLDSAKRLLDLNFYISFSGIMSFKNAANLREIAAYVPLNHILIETDSPWLAPVPQRGKTNEPLFVKHVFEVLCSIRPEDPNAIAETLWKNSCRVYNLNEAS